MKVVISSNIPHYYHAALALQDAGWLEQYFSATALSEYKGVVLSLPQRWQKKLRAREIRNVRPELQQSIWWPEILQRSLARSRLVSRNQANAIFNDLFDNAVSKRLVQSDLFHFVSSIGLFSAQAAIKMGAITVCDERSVHPDFLRRILLEEYEHQGVSAEFEPRPYLGKIKEEYDLADYIVVPSSFVKSTFLEAGISEGKLIVIPYGVDITPIENKVLETEKRPSSPGGVFRVVYAGRVSIAKGVHYLLQAFQMLDSTRIELILAGRVEPELMPFIEKTQRRSGDRLKVLGSVPQSDLFDLFENSDLFVLPSLFDSWGLVTLEAMAMGLPVLVSENCGSKEAVRAGIDGFILPVRDAAALAGRIEQLSKDPELCLAMGANARGHAQSYSWKNYRQHFAEAYQQIQDKHGL